MPTELGGALRRSLVVVNFQRFLSGGAEAQQVLKSFQEDSFRLIFLYYDKSCSTFQITDQYFTSPSQVILPWYSRADGISL
jgi:hypothetical protein